MRAETWRTRDDVAVADEDRGLAISDLAALEMGGAGDDEQLVAINVDLGQLVGLERVLDRQRMEVVCSWRSRISSAVGSAMPIQTNSDLSSRAVDLLVDRDLADALAVAIEIGGDDRHVRPRMTCDGCLAFGVHEFCCIRVARAAGSWTSPIRRR